MPFLKDSAHANQLIICKSIKDVNILAFLEELPDSKDFLEGMWFVVGWRGLLLAVLFKCADEIVIGMSQSSVLIRRIRNLFFDDCQIGVVDHHVFGSAAGTVPKNAINLKYAATVRAMKFSVDPSFSKSWRTGFAL